MKNRLPMLFMLGFVFAFPVLVSAQTYNVYFGDMHSHTWYSDGNKDQDTNTYKKPVARAITYARDVANNMDFLGVSEHNHNESLNMKMGYWRSGGVEADSVNQDGTFVGFYGQEWGVISQGGHAMIYGTKKLFGWNTGIFDVFVAKGDYASLYDSVKKYNGWMYLAHPQATDFGGIFSTYHASWDSVVQGVAVRSGPALTANYTETAGLGTQYEVRYHDLLRLGYHVAPCANQDNHYTSYGMVNQQRTAVLATSLTQANILDALKNRRAYATEDHNLELRFESGAHQMGEIYTTSGNVPLRVKVADPGETFASITIRYGVPGSGSAPTALPGGSATGKDSLIVSQTQPVNTTYYYYAYVVESDGNAAWSAPIWVTTVASVGPPSAFNLTAPTNNATIQPVSGTLTWGSATGATQYDVYFGTSSPGTLVSTNQFGTSYNYTAAYNTSYFWKVVAKNGFGNTDATGSPWGFTTAIAPPANFSLVTPTNLATNQAVSGTLNWSASTGATAYDVYFSTASPPAVIISPDQADTTYNYSGLANSTAYHWRVVAKNAGGSTEAFSSPRAFTTIVGAPGAFTQSSPADSAIDRPVTGQLSWTVSPTAATYDVYLDTAANPTTLVSPDQAGTTYNYSGLSNSTLYRWKIVAKNFSGNLAASNAPTSFTTVIPAPNAFTLLTPPNGAINQQHAGTLIWQASANAATYDVYLDTSASPAVIVSANQAPTSYAYAGLTDGSVYYWKVVAKNAGGSTPATVVPFQFTAINLPAAPSLVISSNVTTSSLQLSWKDNAPDETGYRVYRSLAAGGPFIQQGGDLPANTVFFNDAGLLPNVRYYYQIIPFNGLGEGDHASFNLATLAVPAGPPTLSEATYLSMRVTLNPGVNPDPTQFSIRTIADADTQYLRINGTSGSTPAWGTFEEWGSASGIVISSLHTCKDYAVAVQARNLDNITTTLTADVHQTLQCFSISGAAETGWNLVSLPVAVADQSKNSVFPTSISNAFSYQTGYQQRDTLVQGLGYWLKFNAADPMLLQGEPGTLDSIPVASGWNIIGSVASTVSIGSIIEVPSGLVSSPYFGYSGAYATTDSIHPLHGYWVKASAPGKLVLTSLSAVPLAHPRISAETVPTLGTFTFKDAQGHAQTLGIVLSQNDAGGDVLSELPPRPPQGSFDVRFASQRSTEAVVNTAGVATSLPIELQSPSGAVELSWSLARMGGVQFELSYGAATMPLSGSGSLKLPQGTAQLTLKGTASRGEHLPTAFALHQNYPNPFNPSTEIRYDLPVRSAVRMTVYNLLGVQIATLVDGEQEPGYHAVSWHPQVSSGMYFYKMEAVSSANPSDSFQKTSRMLYLK